eukprot:1151717-Pelagomonas_calceolata.AAC.2
MLCPECRYLYKTDPLVSSPYRMSVSLYCLRVLLRWLVTLVLPGRPLFGQLLCCALAGYSTAVHDWAHEWVARALLASKPSSKG